MFFLEGHFYILVTNIYILVTIPTQRKLTKNNVFNCDRSAIQCLEMLTLPSIYVSLQLHIRQQLTSSYQHQFVWAIQQAQEHLNMGHFTKKALDCIDTQFSPPTTKKKVQGKVARKGAWGNVRQRPTQQIQTQVQQTCCSQSTTSIQSIWIQWFFYPCATISLLSNKSLYLHLQQ